MNRITKKLSVNIYWALLLRLLVVIFIFSICRITFYLINKDLFAQVTFSELLVIMAGGLKFDLSAILYVNIAFIFFNLLPFKFTHHTIYQKTLAYLYYLTNGIAIAANCCDFIYYRFILKRTTSAVFGTFANENHLDRLLFRFLLDYWYIFLFFLLLLCLLVLLYNRIEIRPPFTKNHWIYLAVGSVILALATYLSVAGMRGGFRHSTRPITLSNAGAYVKRPNEIAIVLNTPFSILRTINKKTLERVNYFTDKEAMKEIFSPVHPGKKDTAFVKKNVVVIILESFGKEYIGALNRNYNGEMEYKGYTPFLDSLIGHSSTFYSLSNGSKSIDALPSVISGIPALQTPYVLSHYSSNKITSVADQLKKEGYFTAFFHGAPNGSMGFDSFVNLAGYDHYYGKDEYDNDNGDTADFDGLWGIWDEEFFQFFASKMNTFGEPFCLAIFSVSSHHPYRVPDKYKNVFDKGKLQIHQCVGYTDMAMRKFFQTAKKMSWYDNTVFVITADHTNQSYYPEYQTSLGVFEIPVIFFAPDNSLAGSYDYVAQQIDITPTILNYLNFDQPFVSFGRDLFDNTSDHFAINTINNIYQLAMDDYLLQFDLKKSIGLYRFKEDRLLTKNLMDELPEIRQKMENKVKAIIQEFHNRMIDDKMTLAE